MTKPLKAIFKGKMNFLETSREELSTQIAYKVPFSLYKQI